MTHYPEDPLDARLARAAAQLRRLPEAPEGAVDRVVAAAMARNGLDGRRSPRTAWLARAAAVLAAAGLGAVTTLYGVGRGMGDTPPQVGSLMGEGAAAVTPPSFAQPVAASSADDAPVPTGFALARPGASRVTVIGDFNGWNAGATPMTRDERGVWTTTVALAPGRHAYVFVVDDSVWVTDPRAEVVRDPDYGRAQSVIVVGRP
jgi:hypothetical protein